MTLPELLTTLENARLNATQGEWSANDIVVCTTLNKGDGIKTYPLVQHEVNAKYIALSANHILQLISVIRLQREALTWYSEAGFHGDIWIDGKPKSDNFSLNKHARECLSQCDTLIKESK